MSRRIKFNFKSIDTSLTVVLGVINFSGDFIMVSSPSGDRTVVVSLKEINSWEITEHGN